MQKTFLNKAKKEKKKIAKEHPRNELREQNDKERAHQKYVSNLAFKQNPHITEESNPIHQESSQQTNNMAAGRIMKQNEPAMAII
ncbi:hypothetical protein M1141_03580 [Candidatus Marsarchaeota archaeon]|nr:hypothetical protein [Candidatus Marsarchaeota archaeon]